MHFIEFKQCNEKKKKNKEHVQEQPELLNPPN